MKKILYLIIIVLCLPLVVNGATYSWYFSDDATGNAAGNDTTGDGSSGSPWKTLNKAQIQIDTLGDADIATLYFDRSDTWDASTPNICDMSGATGLGTLCSTWAYGNDGILSLNKGTVHLDAYGTGSKPVFDGLVSDWTTDPVTATREASPAIWVCRDNSSVQNIEVKRVQAQGIQIKNDASNVTISYNKVTDIGAACINNHSTSGATYETVEYNECSYNERRKEYAYAVGWASAIGFTNPAAPSETIHSNTIRYNWIHHSYGEGIIIGSSPGGNDTIVEYNLIGDTKRVGIMLSQDCFDSGTVVVRYNFLYSTIDRSTYDYGSGIWPAYDEECSGNDNSAGEHWVYGNILVGRYFGIYINPDPDGNDEPIGKVRIFNNTIIDSFIGNWRITSQLDDITDLKIYNNASILYDQSGDAHIVEVSVPNYNNATIDNNSFWDAVAGNGGTVDADWVTNYVITDPFLYGEEKGSPVNWDGLTVNTDVTFSDIYPKIGSALIGSGKIIAYEKTFLTLGTDFNDLSGVATFATGEMTDLIADDIGAAIRSLSHTFNIANGATGINIEADLNWTNQGDTTGVNIYFEEDACPIGTAADVSDSNVATFDLGTMNVSTIYCTRVDPINSLVETETGMDIQFTTASGPPVVAGSKATIGWASGAGDIVWNDSGMEIK